MSGSRVRISFPAPVFMPRFNRGFFWPSNTNTVIYRRRFPQAGFSLAYLGRRSPRETGACFNAGAVRPEWRAGPVPVLQPGKRRFTVMPLVMAGWQSGHAAACKAVYGGSIPPSASRFPRIIRLSGRFPRDGSLQNASIRSKSV